MAGVRTARGPEQTSLSPIGTTASQQPSISLLHLRSILVLWKWACTLALKQEQLSSGNILKMTQNVLNCIPLAVESYYAWGPEAFSQLATRLAIRGNTYKSMALTDLYGHLSHSLIRANVLTRSYSHLVQQVDELCVCIIVCIVCGCCAYV